MTEAALRAKYLTVEESPGFGEYMKKGELLRDGAEKMHCPVAAFFVGEYGDGLGYVT